jgi:predicted porin
MNKKLIALAVAAAIAPAAAMADSGNVTIYGQMNVSYDNINTGAAGYDTLNKISSNSSRLGFKGAEDMGNGLSAIWQIESLVDVDVAAGSGTNEYAGKAFAARNTFLGLSSKTMGTALFGRHDTPYKLGTGSLDIFADTLGDYNSIIGRTEGTGLTFDSRLGNVAAYISPTWSGFHFAVATVAAQEADNGATANGKAYSATGVYINGPLFASLSWEKAIDTTGGNSAGVPGTGAGNDASSVKLGLGYTIDALKLGLVYENIGVSTALQGMGIDRTAYLLSASYKMGSNTLKAAFAKANDGDSAADTAAKQWTLGVDHDLSKRTSVYALYTKMDNAAGATYGIGGNGAGGGLASAVNAGDDPRAISLGMRHSF